MGQTFSSTIWLRKSVKSVRASREAILGAARAEFDARGFAGARVQAIADQAGVNKQLIFYYHGSKLGLFRDVIAASLAELSAAAPADVGPQATKRIRGHVADLYVMLADRPHLLRLLTGDAGLDPATAALADTTFAAIAGGFSEIVADGQRLGYFRDDSDAGATARHAISLILGHLLLDQTTPKGPAESRRAQVPEGIARLLLKSLEW
jgi:AcrR family transcriptional regulator